ncbi:HupE/UreJ family protein [Pikeienuella sp. HZG-20]|uniref:HupE/UreJ family protein n=1 Tax=Paludibacillus litoralis TaxID=3133267 RepID=UPI0030EB280F
MIRTTAFIVATLLGAGPAFAHHPLGGAPMATFADGLFSGVAHPVLGFDHLFFIAAVGLAARLSGRALTGPLAFVLPMAAGVLLVAQGAEPPFIEPLIAVTLLVLGLLLARGRDFSAALALSLFAVAGLIHGAAFGAALGGVEAAAALPVTLGYLAGLGALQWALAAGFGMLAAWSAGRARLAGAAVAGVGAFLLLEHAEGAAMAAFGLG